MASRLHTRLLTVEPQRVLVEGELDVATCDELTMFLEELGTAGDIEVDMSRITFIDSTGLNALLTVDGAHRASGSTFVMVDPSPPMQQLLALTHLASHFTIRTT